MRVRPALVAETTIGYVPAGVTGICPGGVLELPDEGSWRPDPQPMGKRRQQSRSRQARRGMRARRSAKRLKGRSAASQNVGLEFDSGCVGRVRDAVVVPVSTTTDTVAVVLRGMLVGVMRQVALSGAPVQARAAVPGMADEDRKSSGKTAFSPLAMVAVVLPSAVRPKSMPVPVR